MIGTSVMSTKMQVIGTEARLPRGHLASRGLSVRARAGKGFADEVKDTVKPRVNELRRQQLSAGTSDIGKIMNFAGPAPELVNGRLAMLGFFAAMSAELVTREPVLQQFSEATGPVVGVSILFAVASIIPIVRGSAILDDGAGEGLKPGSFNVTNELINGRAAMIGLSIMLIYEAVTSLPLFNV